MSKQLSFQYEFSYPIQDVFQMIKKRQEIFFQTCDNSIITLREGMEIKKYMYTKTSHKEVPVKIKVKKLIENHIMEIDTKYQEGHIITKYQFEDYHEKTRVIYSEDNYFHKVQYEMNFQILSFFYKYFYKRSLKKRMQYIESLLQEENYDTGYKQ